MMRQIFEDFFYPLSRVNEYTHNFFVAVNIGFCLASSAAFWLCLIFGSLKDAAFFYAACALFLILLNMSLGVAIAEKENPPLS